MKTLFRTSLTAGLLFTAFTTAAQTVPNGGFETWAVRDGADTPTDWLTIDDVIEGLIDQRLPTGTFTKTSEALGGTYALRLESKQVFLGPIPLGVAPGAVLLGRKLGSNSELGGGIPFTGRPTVLQFYYKLIGNQPAIVTDGAFAAIELTRTVNGKAETVAYAKRAFTAPNPTYTLSQMTLIYSSTATPDSLHIAFGTSSFDIDDEGTAGTILQIDGVALTGGTATATRNAALAATISVSPNPSPDGRYVIGATEPALLAAPLTVLDATGRVVRREATPNRAALATRALDLSGLPTGIHIMQLFTPSGLVTRKLVR